MGELKTDTAEALPAAAISHQPSEEVPCTSVVSCSFCGDGQDKVQRMIIAPKNQFLRAAICDECICVCLGILEDEGFVVEPSKQQGSPARETPQAEKIR